MYLFTLLYCFQEEDNEVCIAKTLHNVISPLTPWCRGLGLVGGGGGDGKLEIA